MKPKTEEFLCFLLWSAELLTRPTFRNLTDSYESWAYRKGFLRQVRSLEESGFLESTPGKADDRLFRLTEEGRLHALGGRDPAIQWTRPWDGRWRLVVFDVPSRYDSRRESVRRFLRSRAFGCLQRSVWISPDPLGEISELLEGGSINVNSLMLFEALPRGGESDDQIVQGAWNFEKINARYTEYLQTLDQLPAEAPHGSAAAKALQRWAAAERQAWADAVSKDPLLPEPLLPSGYLGRQSWRKRVLVLAAAAERLREFKG